MSKDIFLDENGEIERQAGGVRVVEGPSATEVRIRNAVNWQLGEAPIRLGEGIDYLGVFSQKPADTALIASQIRDVVLDDPAVESVEQVGVDVDSENRSVTYTVRGTANEEDEIIVRGGI